MTGIRFTLSVLAVILLPACGNGSSSTDDKDLTLDQGPEPLSFCHWDDHAGNPLIEPPPGTLLVADPTFLPPSETPDGRWHLFAHTLSGIYHYVGDDGIAWDLWSPDPVISGLAIRPYLFLEDGSYHLLYEQVDIASHNRIELRTSPDLADWGEPVVLLEPTLDWEMTLVKAVGNPFLLRRDGQYWLYYSAGSVFLEDAGYFEPTHVGLARADQLEGPYEKLAEPLLSPSADDPLMNLGAGSVKLLSQTVDGLWIAFNNGIYRDAEGRTRSAIRVLESGDGLSWETSCPEPILEPEPGWKEAYVYAFDVRPVGGVYHLFYNARDGWLEGTEYIGLATFDPGPDIR